MNAVKRVDVGQIASYFESLSDPRHERNRKHLLTDIIVIAICGILSNSEGPTAMHRWARARQEWLSTFLRLPNGLPSRDCIRRLLIALKPEAFQKCFEAWSRDTIATDGDGSRKLIAVDGKCCRGSHDRSKDLGPLHLVSAWASEQGIALGQVATEEKSNEITAIPQVLDHIDLKNAVVTIDAIGCQKAIVKQIDAADGIYVIAVKDNQPQLHDAVREVIREQLEVAREDLQYRAYETSEKGHGRVDERTYGVLKIPRDFALHKEWPSLKAVGFATRITTNPDGTQSCDTRCYILNSHRNRSRTR